MIKTTKKAPLPAPRNSYPFRTMDIGESFTVPLSDRAKARAAASQYQIRYPAVKFTGRQEGKAYRLWRIE